MTKLQETTFGDLFEISSSKRVLQRDWKSIGIPFYRAREIVKLARTGQVDNELFITEELYNTLKKQSGAPSAGDLMVSAVGTLGACYVVQLSDRFYYKDASVLKFTPKSDVCSKFIQHAFRTSKILDQINAVGGSTVGTYTIERAKKTKISLPPLAQQKRIAAILDKADEIKRKREQAIAKLDQLAQSIFVEMFGDVEKNNKNLTKESLGKLLKVKSGDFLPATAMVIDGGYAVYGGNGINGHHDAYMFDEKKIVIGRVGAYCGCVHVTQNKSWVTDNALYVDSLDAELDFDYLAFALKVANLNKVSSQSGQPLVSGERIYRVEIIVPPLALQEQFATRISKLEKLKASNIAALEKHNQLFASLQNQAFTGQL